MKRASLSLLLALVSACASSAQAVLPPQLIQVEALAKPAPGPYPTPPGIEFEPGEPLPREAALGRDRAVVGRLTEEGQRATLRFESEAGEVSLFDLTAYGYARGWNASTRIIVQDAQGIELANQRRSGGAQFGEFLPFVAPAAGAYTLTLVADEHYFRYLLVRHSGYRASTPGAAFALQVEQDVAHGWTSDSARHMRFVVHATPGSVIALRAEPTVERGRKHKRALRARVPAVVAGLVDARRLAERMDPRQQDDGTFPDLQLDVSASGATPRLSATDGGGLVLAAGGFAALVRVPAAGQVVVDIAQTSAGPGALFDLVVERDVALHAQAVRVGDEEDDPLGGVEVVLLREPALERIGRATTGEDGTALIDAPAGPYTVVFRAPGGKLESVRTTLTAGATLNLIAGARAPR